MLGETTGGASAAPQAPRVARAPLATDTSAAGEDMQLRLLRAATVGRRWRLALSLTRTTLALARRGLRRARLGASERELRLAFVELHYGAALAARLRDQEDAMSTPAASDMLLALAPVLAELERLGAPYYIGGSLASSAYGVARATLDAALVADLQPTQVSRFVAALQSTYYVDDTAIREAIQYRSSFDLIHLATMIKVDVFITKARPSDDEAFRRIRQESLDDDEPASSATTSAASAARRYALASPEDVVLAKLEWYRLGGETSERQWGDILGVLKVQGAALDVGYVRQWASALSVAELLQRALDEAGFPA